MTGSILSDLMLTISERGRGLLGRNERKADPGVGGLVELCDVILQLFSPISEGKFCSTGNPRHRGGPARA